MMKRLAIAVWYIIVACSGLFGAMFLVGLVFVVADKLYLYANPNWAGNQAIFGAVLLAVFGVVVGEGSTFLFAKLDKPTSDGLANICGGAVLASYPLLFCGLFALIVERDWLPIWGRLLFLILYFLPAAILCVDSDPSIDKEDTGPAATPPPVAVLEEPSELTGLKKESTDLQTQVTKYLRETGA